MPKSPISLPRRVGALLGVLVAVRLGAAPSPTPSATFSPTPTPAPGAYSFTVLNGLLTPQTTPFVVPGSTGNVLQIQYTLAQAFQPGAMLVFQFPGDLCATPVPNGGAQPNANTFYESDPAYQGQMLYTFAGQAVSVTSNNAIAAGTVLNFVYGQDSYGGFAVVADPTASQEAFQVWANVQPQSVATGVGLVPAPSPILVYTATATPTNSPSPTVTPTYSVSPTFTISPTFTVSPTHTPSPTRTPVGPVPVTGFYSYPNPFDLRSESQVTIRFQPTTANVGITVFSLLGYPVRTIPSWAIQPSMGVATWNGVDDYGRLVPGGLYFMRLSQPGKVLVHKLTVIH